MPTYEYRCLECNTNFEKFQSMKDEPVKSCPECQGTVKRLIGSGAGIIFKGGGFYQTDYRSESYNKGKQKESKESTSTPSSPKKTESKAR
ncbi:FmdB family transcriptional regulator [bacterium F16]|nr:FmdB family transcriptional regulator [bacterium F16]